MLASAVFHPAPEVMIIATRFLLESDQRPGSDDENESDDDNVESSGDENMDGKSAQAKAKDLWKVSSRYEVSSVSFTVDHEGYESCWLT